MFSLWTGALDNRGTEFILTFMDNKILEKRDIQPEIFVTTAKHKSVHVTVTSPGLPHSPLNEHFTITNGQVHRVAFDHRYMWTSYHSWF